jgi:hypothetical protein
MDVETDHLCELVADACDLVDRYRNAAHAGERLIGEVIGVRGELASRAFCVADAGVADDALGAVDELDRLLRHLETVRAAPAADQERALIA